MAQELHRFRAASLDEAYRLMRHQLGADAVVLRTAQVREGGILGFLGRTMVELTASAPSIQAKPQARTVTVAERTYADNAAAKIGSDENVAESVAFFQKIVSDAQKRMAQSRAQSEGGAATAAGGSGVVPFRRPKGPADPSTELHREIRELRQLVEVLVTETPGAGVPAECALHYKQLLDAGVPRKIAAPLVASVVRESDPDVIRDPRVFQQRLAIEIRKSVQVTGGVGLTSGVTKRIALVGVTGVGKTTNLAKLAARHAVTHRARVALVTADTYRVAAPEQLRVYANIIGVPMHVTHTPQEMTAVLKTLKDYDVVFIDTAGGSQFNTGQLGELREMLAAARPDETMLVLGANTPLEDARHILTNFTPVKPTSLLFTKLDETRRYGAMYGVLAEAGLPVSYFGTGQNVPDDLVLAQPEMLARLLFNARTERSNTKR
jgi:flagellar biosynthesis protein FlhF